MTRVGKWKLPVLAGLIVAPFLVTGCTTTGSSAKSDKTASTSHVKSVNGVKTYTYTARDRNCLERAMFFESNRSSPDGLVAVGTVVMNRLASGRYPGTVCGVVGQKNQFAPGVLSRKMNSKALPDVQAAADAVLKGKRHPKLKNAMFFHTAGLKFPYQNMHYVLVAGGNSFYEKRKRDGSLLHPVPQDPYRLAFAGASSKSAPDAAPSVQVALARAVTGETNAENGGFGPQAQENRVAPAVAQANVDTTSQQLASYQPRVEASTLDSQSQALGYARVEQKQIDSVGALLLAQDRPETPL
ncbi:cell wall hydrolase [Brucella sp. BE17]|uniref:cell wall hydrolase n=1 Tax=Brucella sp. BE17 TaxID=3142977 RepID=UPI0031BAAE57